MATGSLRSAIPRGGKREGRDPNSKKISSKKEGTHFGRPNVYRGGISSLRKEGILGGTRPRETGAQAGPSLKPSDKGGGGELDDAKPRRLTEGKSGSVVAS